MASEQQEPGKQSTPSTQYDKIGTKYNGIKVLPAAEPEEPSTMKALGDIRGKRCLDLACGTGKTTSFLHRLGASSVTGYDISSSMIDGARSLYPPSEYPNLTFEVRDCSNPEIMQHATPFDIVYAGWFLNYAPSETALTNMFRVIHQNLSPSGKFVGITANAHDPYVTQPKLDFYGLDILVLDAAYKSPDTGNEVGITAKVVVKGDVPFSFECYEFRAEVYEKCAEKAGLKIKWCELVLPDDERVEKGYWKRFVERPLFSVLEAVRA